MYCFILTTLFWIGDGDLLDYLKESLESDQETGLVYSYLFEGSVYHLPQLLPRETT